MARREKDNLMSIWPSGGLEALLVDHGVLCVSRSFPSFLSSFR